MTAIASSPLRSWVSAQGVLMIAAAFAITLAAAATFTIVLLTSLPSSWPATNAPVPEELTDTQKACRLARVVGC
jgi:hypothetical protein